MSKPLTHRPFAELEPPAPEVTFIRRRRTDPESGLKLVRQIRVAPLPTDPPPTARLTPDPTESESESVAKKPKKQANHSTPEQREIALARIKALVDAGNTRDSALKSVGKEMGFGPGTLNKWLVEARKAAKNKRSPESIAKQKATLAKKRRKASPPPETKRSAADFIRFHKALSVKELVKLAKKEGLKFTSAYAYSVRAQDKKKGEPELRVPIAQRKSNGPSSNEKSLGDLLETIADAAMEIKRRLSQLTL